MVTNIGNNPQIPGIRSDAYLPDQLIIGKEPITFPALITGGVALKRGTVLGAQTNGKAETPIAKSSNLGNGAITAVAAKPATKTGRYTITFTGPTTATVTDPSGVQITPMTASGAYVDAQLNFTFTPHTNAMVSGDQIYIDAAAPQQAYLICQTGAADGSQAPAAILVSDADASAGDVFSGVYKWGEFNARALILDPSLTLTAAQNALDNLGIYVKQTVPASDPY